MIEKRCAVKHSLEGQQCFKPGTVEYHGEYICEQHARRFASTAPENSAAHWEGIVFHLEVWIKRARERGEIESVRGLEESRAQAIAELYVAALDLSSETRARVEVQNATAHALLAALRARDRYTGDHSAAVVELAVATAKEMGLDKEEIAVVEQAALLHDVGKIGVLDSIVNKPGPLDESEWEQMKEHPAIGAGLVASVEGLFHLAPVIRAEHERWDGWGYPDGLSGEEIPVASRIVFACDAYHAMTSDRPYRAAIDEESATEELERNAGTQFCPRTVQALLTVLRTRRAAEQRGSGTVVPLVRPAVAEGNAYSASKYSSFRPGNKARGKVRHTSSGGADDEIPTGPTVEPQIQEALRESEERYRLLVELSPNPIAIHCEGKVIYINPAGAETLGAVSPNEIIGKSIMDFVHPEHQKTVAERIRRVMEESWQPDLVEEKMIRLDGKVLDVEVTAIPVLYNGKPAIQVIGRDITERKRAEEALKKSEERFRALVQYASDIITVLEPDGTIRYESPSIQRLLGYSPEELIGENAFELLHPDDFERVLEVFVEALGKPGASRRVEFRFRHKDGSWRHFEGIGNNLLDDPVVEGIIINSRDITERKEAGQ